MKQSEVSVNDDICSSPKEQIHHMSYQKVLKFKTARTAQDLMNITIRVLMHSPKKFRPNYISHINQYTIDIFEKVNKANFYKDTDRELAKRCVNEINMDLLLLQSMLDCLRMNDGLTKDNVTKILEAVAEFTDRFDPWANKFILSCE